MSLRDLPPLLRDDPTLAGLAGATSAVLAVPEPARAFTMAGLAHLSGRHPIVVATPTATDAERVAHDLRAFLGEDEVDVFPAWETLPFERVSPSVETMGRRLRAMWRLRDKDRMPRLLVAPVKALVQRLGPHVEDVEPVIIKPGERLDESDLLSRLVGLGYRREYQVEHRGEVAVRGSIVDVFPSTADTPVRIDLWGDEVDRLTEVAVADQRSTDDIACAEIFGCRELLPTDDVRSRATEMIGAEPWGREQWERLAEGQIVDGLESWLPWLTAGEHVLLDLVGDDAQLLLVEPRRMRDRAAELLDEEAALAGTLAQTWGAEGREFPKLHLPFDRLLAHTEAPAWTVTTVPEGPDAPAVTASGWDPVVGDASRLTGQIAQLLADGYKVVVCADGEGTAARIASNFRDEGLTDLEIVVQPLERGFLMPAIKLAVLAEADITGRRRSHRRARTRPRGAEAFFDSLEPGGYVVHHQHGVARYGGMVTRAIGGTERDYLLLEYRGADKLYVPSDQIDTIRPYTGGETPSLSKLGGSDWQKAKARVRSAVREIAQELVVLYQRRITTPGHAFPADTPWQHELEEAFPYQETPDQLKAIVEMKADMEEPTPMDRLVCGDVGYGKTEVAVRAAFKAVHEGTQVVVLVPTTLLAGQHGQTFRERFANYPVRVEVLSRFLTTKEQHAVVRDFESGAVDVLIGTHRLLSTDVKPKHLGLLVVDEEQRFGVQHKELIKQLATNVDVLTLTATPIPRTLELSLTGIRDLSLVNTPPEDRQPILTYVGEYDDRAVAEAIRRELLREGQVFFVHNRVRDIELVAENVRALVPDARVAVAHGQMDEGRLERVVLDFAEHEFDVLVCTTIVESGIDMPTVNTLVVDRSDLLGLAQMYQLRGRVGRRGQRAYAYLLHPADRVLTEEAYERLKTIGEFTDLGSGFKIAMRDLEIRGAGNLLGQAQSGHIAAVGFDLYCQMVTEAVGELKGEPVPEPLEITIDVPIDANLPRDYVQRDDVRMEAYRRLAAVTADADVDDIRDEWEDRYGPPPPSAVALLDVARLRVECVRLGIRSITVQRNTARIVGVTLKESQKVRLRRLVPKAVAKEDELVVPVSVAPAAVATTLVELLRELLPQPAADSAGAAPALASAAP
jgi:transcription-repair coupling factor (superfamily II helicase)